MTAVLALLPQRSSAQFYFGKNKVQYATFDWQVMTTEHFDIYFYKDEAEIGRIAARIAEDAYPGLAARFNHEVRHRIPLIIYSAPNYFSQTNVVPGLLPEAVGGFTEFLKGRVVVPFHGSFHDFEHVITHELVHVFQLSKLDAVTSRQSKLRYAYPPLWFIEGLAEFWSQKWNTEGDMIVKDMVISGRLISVPDFWMVQGTFFMYKLGQSVCKFIDEEYGSDKLVLIFENWTKGRTFEQVLELTLGDDIRELSRKWEYHLKKEYYPEIEDLGLPKMESDQLTYDGYCVKGVPITWDDGDGAREWIVYMAHRRGYAGLYLKPRRGARGEVKTLLKGERSSAFESLHLLRSGIDARNDGKILFSSRSGGHDRLYIYDLNHGKVTAKFEINSLIAVRSPRFSPNGRRAVFTGIRTSGESDLFLIDLTTGDYHELTHDVFNDVDPTFTPDGNRIVFASDRCATGASGTTNLYELELHFPRRLTQLTFGPHGDLAPDATPDGIYFSSDRQGVLNLFYRDGRTGEISRQSTFVTGAADPRLTPDGKALVYSGYQDTQFHVYQMTLPERPEPVPTITVPVDTLAWYPESIDKAYAETSIKYETDYSFDIAQSTVSYDPIVGSIGGVQAMVSDMLGDHLYYMLITNTAETNDELLESFNVGVTYVNKEKRYNWGVGLFHLYDEYYNRHDLYFLERQAGALGLFSYPISMFNRIDFTTFARYDKKERRYGQTSYEGFLVTNYLSWVYDNSIWDVSGPIEGRRYNISVGITSSVSEGVNHNRQASADIRHYIRLGSASAFASRLFGYTSAGREPRRLYFGGSWSFRGYDRREFYSRNILFASNELRFPLIDALQIGFPFGGMGFRGIRGALFFDVGSAWNDEFDQFLGSFGYGFRVSLGRVILLRFDFARTTDFETISPGTDFDFFFGWNF